MLYGLFKHMAQFSNQNLSRNVTYLNLKQQRNASEMKWSIGSSNSRFDSTKFKLTYGFLEIAKQSLFMNLPDEIWTEIIFLSISEIYSFKFLCKYFFKIANFQSKIRHFSVISHKIFDINEYYDILFYVSRSFDHF